MSGPPLEQGIEFAKGRIFAAVPAPSMQMIMQSETTGHKRKKKLPVIVY